MGLGYESQMSKLSTAKVIGIIMFLHFIFYFLETSVELINKIYRRKYTGTFL